MKNNLLLFGLLITLLLGTYLIQEKKDQAAFEKIQTEGMLFRGTIHSLKLNGNLIEKKSNQWWFQDSLLSFNSLNNLEKKIFQLKKIKVLDGKRESYFQKNINFEVNGVPWSLGEMTLDKSGFYLGNDKETYLAIIDGESGQIVENDSEIEEAKYTELVNILSSDISSLKEKQLFRFFPELNPERVQVKADQRPGYEIDFTKNQTIPGPFAGIVVHENLREKFYSLITQMMIKDEIKSEKIKKFKKMSSISFIDKEGKIRNWDLWISSKESADAYLVDSVSGRIFLMVGGTLKGFFINLQDYWDKKVIPPQNFNSFTETQMILTDAQDKETIEIKNKEPLEFKASGKKIDFDKMNQLVQVIFNLAQFDQGERVSPLSKTEYMQILNEKTLKVSVLGQDLILWQRPEELIVVNLNQKFKVHFAILKENFSTLIRDMVK